MLIIALIKLAYACIDEITYYTQNNASIIRQPLYGSKCGALYKVSTIINTNPQRNIIITRYD